MGFLGAFGFHPPSKSGGGGGDDKNYVHTQSIPSDTWVVNHNLDKRCSVQVVNELFQEIIADITWVDNNTVYVYFNTETIGYVYCN